MTPHVTELPCMKQFRLVDGCLALGGRPVTELAREAGGTPFYAYDRGMLDARLAELRGCLPRAVHLHYAVKANPMPAVVEYMAERVDGLDVASAAELELALNTGTSPGDISFAGPGKRDGELAAALQAGIVINLESFGEMERVHRLAEAAGQPARVAVRVNPDFELKSSGMRMGGGARPFGVDAEQVPELLQRIGDYGLSFQGFQIFAGSQNLRTEALTAAQDGIFELAYRLAEQAPGPVKLLNVGGGLGIPYFPNDRPLDLNVVTDHLAGHVETCARRLGDARVVLELGRYLVGEAGVYVARVIDRKISRGRVYLVTDGGMHHHLAASGNLGQVIRKNYPVAVATRMTEAETGKASIVGPLCTPLDILAEQVDVPAAEPGDLIAVFQSGAYGLSASPVGFLGQPMAAELLV